MPNLLKKLRSKGDEAKGDEAKSEKRISKSPSPPPPEYTKEPTEFDQDNVLDVPDITAGFSNLSFDRVVSDPFPISNECIAHLKLLECFYRLRQKIGSADGLFGIDNSIVLNHVAAEDAKAAELLAKLAEKRWAVYLARAVDRFESWLNGIMPDSRMITLDELETQGEKGTLCDPASCPVALHIDGSNMPPVDVLMVWHAYMLNPRSYLEDCLRFGRMQLWHAHMPWDAITVSINSETFEYEPSKEAAGLFTGLTQLPWDNLASEDLKKIECPSCQGIVSVPWTRSGPEYMYDFEGKMKNAPTATIDQMFSEGKGYCDLKFYETCTSCKGELNHENLRAGKFCKDLQRLIAMDVPMGGTTLGIEGIPFKFGKVTDSYASLTIRPPNGFLSSGLGQEILKIGKTGQQCHKSMDSIRDEIELKLKDKLYLKDARRGSARIYSRSLSRPERIAIRKMMSRYWDNSTPFALDLVGAVVRQGTFIEKMHSIDWLHSPALLSTTKRLLVKYRRFVEIMSLFRNRMVVPTLDVDIAWHTHQLNPHAYMTYTVDKTRQFVDHDDKVAEVQLNDSFAWTSKTYQKKYGSPYSECTCWYCEAIRESHTSTSSRLFSSGPSQAEQDLASHNAAAADPSKAVHISAHNAVRPTEPDMRYVTSARTQQAELERHYQKACQRARKKGRPEPKRNDYYYSDAWGYPVYIPAYSPYVGYVPYAPMYYPATPGCMALGVGASGNCCSGTCGGGVAAGACGSAGMSGGGACAGGSSIGGCGGGGGFGGGGGCGGGGGGGGGCGGGGGGGGCGGGGC